MRASSPGALAEHVLGLAQLDALVGGERAAQELEGALRGAHQVDEPALGVVGQRHPHGARAAVEPAQHATLGGAEFGGEAQHLVGGGVELIARHDDHGAAIAQRAVRREKPLHSQRRGDSDGGEREGREWLDERDDPRQGDLRYRPHDSEADEESEDRQHQPGVMRVVFPDLGVAQGCQQNACATIPARQRILASQEAG